VADVKPIIANAIATLQTKHLASKYTSLQRCRSDMYMKGENRECVVTKAR